MNAVTAAKLLIRRLAHDRIHVDRIHGLAVGMLVKHPANGAKHIMHGLAEVFAAVRRNKDELVRTDPI